MHQLPAETLAATPDDVLILRLGGWHLEVVWVRGRQFARWWCGGAFWEVPVGRA